MANKRNAKSINNNQKQNDTVPSEAPLFVAENKQSENAEPLLSEEEILSQKEKEKEILEEIQNLMAEGSYNKDEKH